MSYDSRYQLRDAQDYYRDRDDRDRDNDRGYRYRDGDRDRDRDRERDRDHHYSLPPRPSSGGTDSYRPPAYPGRDSRYGSRDQDYPRHSFRTSGNSSSYSNGPPPPPPPQYDQPPPPMHPPQGDFTFRVEKPASIDTAQYDSYRPTTGRRRDRQGRSGQRGGRGTFRFLAANRPILRNTHATGPEQLYYDAGAAATYRPVDELSDDEEADMDISDESDTGDASGQSHEPSKKRARVAVHRSASEENTPKWSNPDPYTALPPPDATQQKKKDVVQLIRKARVQAKETKSSVPAEAEDFIAIDFDDESDRPSEGEVEDTSVPAGEPAVLGVPHGVPGAPTGPRIPNLPRSADRDTTLRQPSTQQPNRQPIAFSIKGSSKPPGSREATKLSHKLAAAEDPGTSALGSRKRTHDDRIILPAHSRLKKVTKMPAGGALAWDWQIKDGEDPCPWLVADHSGCASMGVWLHKEIVDFYEHVRPRDFEQRIRQDLIDELKAICRATYRDAEVYPFGSFPSGLYLPTGDMDLVLCSDSYLKGGRPKHGTKSALFKLRSFLQQRNLAHLNEFELILHAKVPLVKYIDRRTGLKMDISFENTTGLQAIETFLKWKEQYAAMPILVTLIKHFLFMRGLNEPVNGGIGGFSVICLVVSMLQMMPQVQSRSMNTAHHLGDLLLEFFDLYGNRFNYRTTAISLNPPRYISKNAVTTFAYKNQDRLSIIDPNNPANDIAGGSSNTPTILQLFSEAHQLLSKRMVEVAQSPEKGKASILEVIFAGDYSTFRNQRAHLLKLSRRGLASEEPTGHVNHGGHW